MKRPAFQFYPADWRKDTALQSCSMTARGLWHEMLCVMHECKPYGHLVINAKAPDEIRAARLVGMKANDYRRCLAELEAADVFSRTHEGVIFSRRMVKDEHTRGLRAEAGKHGGNPVLLNQKDKQNPTPTTNLLNQAANLKPTPSARVSAPARLRAASALPSGLSSSSESKAKAPRLTRCPPDFGISERVKSWAEDKGHLHLDTHFEKFMSYVKTKQPKYADWDEALMTCIRENWAKVGQQQQGRNGQISPYWWTTDSGTIAKGKEFGLTAKGGESMEDFRGRIRQRIAGA